MLPITFTFKHVHGHQDSGLTTVLNSTAWMNIEMDLLAKATINSNIIGPQKYQINGEPWISYIQGQRQMSMALCTHINTIAIETHWTKKQQYKAGNASMVDFESTGRAIRGLPKAQQQWVEKSAAKFLPYGTNMQRWKL